MRKPRNSEEEVAQLAGVLRKRYPRTPYVAGLGWGRNSALSVLDCVLSLNRRYDGFVLPRIHSFREAHPTVRDLGSLDRLMRSRGSARRFLERDLAYRHPGRAKTLAGVVSYLRAVLSTRGDVSEATHLRRWALSSRPEDYREVGVRGFGLAGFQYLRMLFGAQTTKPDIHIRREVGTAIGRTVSDTEALYLLERAARRVGLRLRHLDAAIWNRRARGA